jgi:methylase of polypeptide subunit release factors
VKILADSHSKFKILYYENVDIDGLWVRYDFARLIAKYGKKQSYQRAHEWCSGHGAIGFEILASKLCEHLVLTDCYAPAAQGCEFTAAANNIQHKTTVYNCDRLSDIPVTEKWDLFVANPPWWFNLSTPNQDYERKMVDTQWRTHRDLYTNIRQYLTNDADVFVYEDSAATDPDFWQDWYQNAGLKLVDVHHNFGITETGYVLHLKCI